MTTPSILPSLLAFAIVVAAIPVALALLKRAQSIRPGRRGLVNVVGGASLGPRERIAVIETGGKWLVVGVTSQSISLLTTLDQAPDGSATLPAAAGGQPTGAATPPDSTPPRTFGQWLARFRDDARPAP